MSIGVIFFLSIYHDPGISTFFKKNGFPHVYFICTHQLSLKIIVNYTDIALLCVFWRLILWFRILHSFWLHSQDLRTGLGHVFPRPAVHARVCWFVLYFNPVAWYHEVLPPGVTPRRRGHMLWWPLRLLNLFPLASAIRVRKLLSLPRITSSPTPELLSDTHRSDWSPHVFAKLSSSWLLALRLALVSYPQVSILPKPSDDSAAKSDNSRVKLSFTVGLGFPSIFWVKFSKSSYSCKSFICILITIISRKDGS